VGIRKTQGPNTAALKRAREADLEPKKPEVEGEQPEQHSTEELRAVANGRGTLQLGDEGPGIAELQSAVGLEPTGTFDEELQKRITSVQGASGLRRTGVVDADTLYALNSALQAASPLMDKLIGNEQREAIEDLDKAVDEGTGLFAHKRIAAVEFASLGLLTVRNAGEAASKVGKIGAAAGGLSKVADLVGPVLVPITAFYAAKDVRAAVKAHKDLPKSEVQAKRAKHATNRAAGSVGYFASVAAGTAKEVIKTTARSGGFLGKLVPGLNVIVAAGDITWATTVCRDPDSSKKKKACACASAVGSVISMVTPPPISWAASAIASGGLLASNFV
jgi:hypothetical protein